MDFKSLIMERIYKDFTSHRIDLYDVYSLCKSRLKLSKEDALISACLTLIVSQPSKRMLQKYDQVSDVFYEEPEYVYNKLYEECPCLARKFNKAFGPLELINPVLFDVNYE